MRAVPRYANLTGLALAHPLPEFGPDRLERERRILYAYSEMLAGCCTGACRPQART